MSQSRYLDALVRTDLKTKMAFIGGPRQVGKTTFGLGLLGPQADERHPAYLSWDDVEDRQRILEQKLPPNETLVILDEIQKHRSWRNLVKGLYDKNKSHVHFIVTGSSRLDYFLRGGDTLQGRYHHYRLHPFSLPEISRAGNAKDLQHLLKFGGFPEPLLSGKENTLRRWQLERNRRVVYDDLRNLENVREITLIENLISVLPDRVGSPLSVEKLRTLLESSHPTTERYIQILERLYAVFRIPPFGTAKVKAVKKEQKLYLWDWSQVPDAGARFENLVASHLLKYCHFIEDSEGYAMDLRFIRNVEGREIDFVILKDRKPVFAVECKSGERSLSPHLSYFKDRLKIPEVYQVHLGTQDYGNSKTTGRVLPFTTFCKEIPLV